MTLDTHSRNQKRSRTESEKMSAPTHPGRRRPPRPQVQNFPGFTIGNQHFFGLWPDRRGSAVPSNYKISCEVRQCPPIGANTFRRFFLCCFFVFLLFPDGFLDCLVRFVCLFFVFCFLVCLIFFMLFFGRLYCSKMAN